jgi:hypothetical protein
VRRSHSTESWSEGSRYLATTDTFQPADRAARTWARATLEMALSLLMASWMMQMEGINFARAIEPSKTDYREGAKDAKNTEENSWKNA